MQAAPEARLDYLEVLDPTTLQPPRPPLDADQRGEARQGHAGGIVRPMELLVAAAAFVGPARLIDNVLIGDREDEDRLLAATS
jgi:pantothenate synthetase